MRILIGQPKFETGILQLTNDIQMNSNIDLVLYPEGYLDSEKALEEACTLAKTNNIIIISSLRKNNKDIAISINSKGNIDYLKLVFYFVWRY